MGYKIYVPVLLAALFVSGCQTWSSANMDLKDGQTKAEAAEEAPKKSPKDVIVSTNDITNRPYTVLGDIDVTVNKTTIFHADPTKEAVNKKLQEEAASIGADAVILVRYGSVSVSIVSWGSLDGKGRAIVFKK